MRCNWNLLLAIGVMSLLAPAADLTGQTLGQPTALTVAAPVKQDAKLQPVACCETADGSCCCFEPMCCPKCVTEEVEKSCWKVSSELVCIPGFRWPWECRQGDCKCGHGVGDGCVCPPKCGRVRCVNVLEQHKYTCDQCGYEWEIKCVRSADGCSCAKGGCPHCGCDPSCGATEAVTATKTAKKPTTLWERLSFK
jgi:hypothetical protein